MRSRIGYLIIVGCATLTLILYFLSKPQPDVVLLSPWVSLSQVLALVGLTLFSLTFVLTTRAPFLENLFGGLDKVARVHHLLGTLSFLALVNHPLLLGPSYLLPSSIASYNYGLIAFYVMVLVLIFTFLIRLPYQLWLKTHDFMGLSLVFAGLHLLNIGSDISRFPPLRFWVFL